MLSEWLVQTKALLSTQVFLLFPLLWQHSLSGGGIAGLGGSAEIMGMYNRFIWFGSQPGYGFDGVLVGVLAGNNRLWFRSLHSSLHI